MSFSVALTASMNLEAIAQKVFDIGTPRNRLSASNPVVLSAGSSAGQANTVWHNRFTLSGVVAQTFDLSAIGDGFFRDATGTGIEQLSFSAVKYVFVRHVSGDVNVLLYGAGPILGMPWGLGELYIVPPVNTAQNSNGVFVAASPGDGWAVNANNKLIGLVKSAAGAVDSVVDVFVAGVE